MRRRQREQVSRKIKIDGPLKAARKIKIAEAAERSGGEKFEKKRLGGARTRDRGRRCCPAAPVRSQRLGGSLKRTDE